MAKIDDLIGKIENPELRQRIEQEVAKMQKQRKFGLVFEEHLPECTPLFDIPVTRGCTVALKSNPNRGGQFADNHIVTEIKNGKATCEKLDGSHTISTFDVDDLVVVAQFGEPIYPFLKKIDSVQNAPDSDLWHTLIEADNYHALQLLVYLYAGQVDCIYIDPPYNTGARDWKYNNDYVDSSDAYRHSKWLSMMQKRLQLAKKLLNPKDSVLIVTIDEKEYLHLGCLLEQMFPEARMQMISSLINITGVANDRFGRTDEYIYIIYIGDASPQKLPLENDWIESFGETTRNELHWRQLLRSGSGAMHKDSPGCFYPIYVNKDGTKIIEIGESLPLSVAINQYPTIDNTVAVFPIHLDGTEGRWQVSPSVLREYMSKGYVKLGGFTKRGMAINYLAVGEQRKIENGEFVVQGYDDSGAIVVDDSDYQAKFVPGSQWRIRTHDASRHGTGLINNIIGNKKFSFPKSLYATHDAIRFFVANKPNALIVDFFAGSGTTLHAVNLLNAEDGGHRRCILVTNNEVSDAEAKEMTARGLKPGDEEWEKLGIARYVTWPRTVCSIEGHDVNGNPLKGNYIGSEIPMADGFKSNAVYFKLGFLNKTNVSLGREFARMLSLLWMKAGAHGVCPEIEGNSVPDMLVLPENQFAVLNKESLFMDFAEKVNDNSNIKYVFIITDSNNAYRDMISHINTRKTFQLYRDYLDNFRINQIR